MKIKQGSTWRDVPRAGNILEPGTSGEYKTGSWRSQRPIFDAEKCNQCSRCWMFCPDMSVKLDDDGRIVGFDYDYCKGCGLCEKVCPPKANAITMVIEGEGE